MQPPKLIAIEGPDKVGKATQTKLLVEKFKETYDTRSAEIPFNDGNTYTKIYDMLKDGSALEYPQAFQTFQAANRMVWQKYELPKMAHHEFIVLDRWNVSSWVYGRASGLTDTFLSCILDRVIKADLVFVLDGEAMDAPTDSYEADTNFMKTVREEYQRWAKESGAIVIDANRSREIVHQEIWKHCQQSLDLSD